MLISIVAQLTYTHQLYILTTIFFNPRVLSKSVYPAFTSTITSSLRLIITTPIVAAISLALTQLLLLFCMITWITTDDFLIRGGIGAFSPHRSKASSLNLASWFALLLVSLVYFTTCVFKDVIRLWLSYLILVDQLTWVSEILAGNTALRREWNNPDKDGAMWLEKLINEHRHLASTAKVVAGRC